MQCERPNRIILDANYKGIEFLGPAPYLRELHESRLYHSDGYERELFYVPCGQCDPCRIRRRYERATRIMCEALCYKHSTFVTLTYDDDHLGSNDLLEDHVTQFKKDIRRIYGEAKYTRLYKNPKRKTSSYTFQKFKFITTGEYGDKAGRKHYHLIIFGLDFKDKEYTGFYSERGNPIATSKELQNVWKKGNVQVETVNYNLALYVSKYITDGWDDDECFNPATGEVRRAQYSTSSHGLGLTYLKKYYRTMFNLGSVKFSDRTCPIPRYFHKKVRELIDPLFYARWKSRVVSQTLAQQKQNVLDKGPGDLARAIREGEYIKHLHKKDNSHAKDVR